MALVREDFLAGVGMKNCQRLVLGSLRNDYDDGNENGKKAIGLDKQNNNFAITLFCTLLCRRCTSTTLNCLISRFFEDRTKRKQLSFSFPGLWCSPLESNSKKVCHHLTNWTRWNKRDKVWGSANSLFEWRFRSRRRRRLVNSLLSPSRSFYISLEEDWMKTGYFACLTLCSSVVLCVLECSFLALPSPLLTVKEERKDCTWT